MGRPGSRSRSCRPRPGRSPGSWSRPRAGPAPVARAGRPRRSDGGHGSRPRRGCRRGPPGRTCARGRARPTRPARSCPLRAGRPGPGWPRRPGRPPAPGRARLAACARPGARGCAPSRRSDRRGPRRGCGRPRARPAGPPTRRPRGAPARCRARSGSIRSRGSGHWSAPAGPPLESRPPGPARADPAARPWSGSRRGRRPRLPLPTRPAPCGWPPAGDGAGTRAGSAPSPPRRRS